MVEAYGRVRGRVRGRCGVGRGGNEPRHGYHDEGRHRRHRDGRGFRCRCHRGAGRLRVRRRHAVGHPPGPPGRRHRAVPCGRRAQDDHERRQLHGVVQRGEGHEGLRHRPRRPQRGYLLRPCGLLHLREHVPRQARVRCRAHRGGHADLPSVPGPLLRPGSGRRGPGRAERLPRLQQAGPASAAAAGGRSRRLRTCRAKSSPDRGARTAPPARRP